MKAVIAGAASGTGKFDINRELETVKPNINGRTSLIDTAYRYFINRRNGHIAVITSAGGLAACGFCPAYNASKAYQISYTRSLRARAKSVDVKSKKYLFEMTA